jgi:putative addiction module component (TIGR02574 family)
VFKNNDAKPEALQGKHMRIMLTPVKNLPLPERLELLDALWESIVEEGYEPPLTTAQADEIDRRLRAHQRNPDDVVDWKAIKTELDSKFGRD